MVLTSMGAGQLTPGLLISDFKLNTTSTVLLLTQSPMTPHDENPIQSVVLISQSFETQRLGFFK
jgi:hypothetical protein